MPDFYKDYKPLRNYLQQFDLVSNLRIVWALSVHLAYGEPLPSNFLAGMPWHLRDLKGHIYPWDLDVIARELILNAGSGGPNSLKRWNDLATVTNHLRRLDNLSTRFDGSAPNIMLELHRIGHRQFPWHNGKGVNPVMRARKVFGTKELEAIANRELGMSAQQFLLMGAAIAGHFLKNSGMRIDRDFSTLGISHAAQQAFYARIARSLPDLRAEYRSQQRYNADWQYVWNPLEATPLVQVDEVHIVCPVPPHLMRRTSAGLYYDLVDTDGFANPFGCSFESYIGELLRATCPDPPFSILEERAYTIHGETHHGADWVLSDETGHIFIEAKTKRLSLGAKNLTDAAALERDLETMAKAVVQDYKNILDAKSGKTHWTDNGRPIFPLIVMLEDWFIFSPAVNAQLQSHVRRLLARSSIDEGILEDMPYTIASAHECEIAFQVIAEAGVAAVMNHKTGAEQRAWSLLPFITRAFPAEMSRINYKLFESEFLQLVPERPAQG